MRSKEPFSLTKRKVGKKTVYYYIAYNETGIRKKYSTGCTTKTQAMAYVMDLFKRNALIPSREKTEVLVLNFQEYATPWWTKDCDYIKGEKERGRNLSEQYIYTNRHLLKNHILPYFGEISLFEITTPKLEKWQRSLMEEKGLAPKSANNILSILSVMLEEARRQQLIPINPCKEVRALANKTTVRGILSLEEAKDMLTNLAYWDNPAAYSASLLASCTGMRLGEIRALRGCDIRDGYIHIEHSVDLHGALKSTKTGDSRDIPLPPRLMEALLKMKSQIDTEDRLFSVAGVPMSSASIRDGLYRALKAKGISTEERKERNITFHSWRHFLNSQLLSHGITGEKTRKITGHATESMTEYYAHFLVEDFRDVLNITESIVENQ
jgi:integrase